jgi:hypothetical protein
MSNPGYAVTIPELVGALSGAGLALDQMDRVGDSNYTIPSGDRVVATFVSLTTSRTWTLPAAGSVNAGHPIIVVDLAGAVTGSNTLVIARAGTDTMQCHGILSIELDRQRLPQLCRFYLAPSLSNHAADERRMRLVRVPKGVEKALIGTLLIAALAWAFLYDHVLEDEPQPMQLQPSAQFIGGDF